MTEKEKIYKGQMGSFLEYMSRPSVEELVMDALNKHNGKMALKKLLLAVDSPIKEILDTIENLKNYSVVKVYRRNNDDVVRIIKKP